MGLSRIRINELVKEGVLIQSEDGSYNLADCIRRYVDYKVGLAKNASDSSSKNDRLKDAKAQEIELKLQQRERTLVRLDDAIAQIDWVVGKMLAAMSGIPARVTRNPRERQRIEQIINGVRQRLADDFEKRQRDFAAGRAVDETDGEPDA